MEINMAYSFENSYDILPLGDFETIPVIGDPDPLSFPDVVRLGITYDPEKIREDYFNLPDMNGKDHFIKRAKYFKQPIRKTMEMFDELGFSMDKYIVFPIRKIGTNELIDELGEYTRFFLERFPVNLFRQQFALAKGGFKTSLHEDHTSFKVHGYRLFIPIDTAYIDIEDRSYEMLPGDCYFVNVGKKHSGRTDKDRILLMCQMDNERLIREGVEVKPL